MKHAHLAFSGKLMSLIIGTRFLTDYLEGDHYYKIHRDGHKLDRCRTQFRLTRSIAENEEEMRFIVEKLYLKMDMHFIN